MKILTFSRYDKLGASSRLRLYQYIDCLESAGIELEIVPFFNDDYILGLYKKEISTVSITKAYFRRFSYMLKIRKFDYKEFGDPFIREIVEKNGSQYFYLYANKNL